MLECAYYIFKFPDTNAKVHLARGLGVDQENINVWFQNRRARGRKTNELFGRPHLIDGLDTQYQVLLHVYTENAPKFMTNCSLDHFVRPVLPFTNFYCPRVTKEQLNNSFRSYRHYGVVDASYPRPTLPVYGASAALVPVRGPGTSAAVVPAVPTSSGPGVHAFVQAAPTCSAPAFVPAVPTCSGPGTPSFVPAALTRSGPGTPVFVPAAPTCSVPGTPSFVPASLTGSAPAFVPVTPTYSGPSTPFYVPVTQTGSGPSTPAFVQVTQTSSGPVMPTFVQTGSGSSTGMGTPAATPFAFGRMRTPGDVYPNALSFTRPLFPSFYRSNSLLQARFAAATRAIAAAYNVTPRLVPACNLHANQPKDDDDDDEDS